MVKRIINKLIKNSDNGLLLKDDLLKLTKSQSLVISPLLEEDQIGEVSTDFRIGLDFLTLQQGRDPYIDTTINDPNKRPIRSHFSETRRKLGEYFLLHPGQPVLFSTLEYVKLPNNVYGVLSLRSSYSRLGLTISTIVQPGYCGCFSVEIVNNGKVPIKLMVGARILQARFIKLKNNSEYFNKNKIRKYTCQVRPAASKVNEDKELEKLNSLYKVKD